jgi:formylglycine-generating enzyme required for sulfatase activity
MKKSAYIFLISSVLLLFFASIAASANYKITQIDDGHSGYHPRISSNGHVTWYGYDGPDKDIFYYNGSTTIQLTNNGYQDQGPQINSNGHVVWWGEENDNEIFYYNGSTVSQLTDNGDNDNAPQINSNGHVVWQGAGGKLLYYNGSTTFKLTDNGYKPMISDNGYVVWLGYDGPDYEIFYYNGSTVSQLTDNDDLDRKPQINSNGHVVWQGGIGPDTEIFYYNGSTTIQLTNNDYQDDAPQINSNGHVVWWGEDGSDSEIFYYDGSTVSKITDNDYNDYEPKINSNGHVVWNGGFGSLSEIFYYDGSTITKITDNGYSDGAPQINSNGHVVWTGGYGYGAAGVFYAVPIKKTAKVVSYLTISGSTTVDENSGSQFTCKAYYTDGTNAAVSPSWSENSSYTSINSAGYLSTSAVSSNQSCTITASLEGKTDTHSVTIKKTAKVVSYLTISGSTSVDENSGSQFTCKAYYTDGTNAAVSPSWTENSSYTSINSAGYLSTSAVPSNQNCIITANLGGKTDTHSVTIKNTAKVVSYLTISGSTSVDENSGSQFTCKAYYTDGTNAAVSPSWTENSSYTSINSAGYLSTSAVLSNQNCTITASLGGKTDTHSVTIKNTAKVVSYLTISGSTSVDENSGSQFTCKVYYTDGSSTTVFPSWSQDSNFANINNSGYLSTYLVTTNQSCTITASLGGKTDTHSVTIKKTAKVVSFLTISGSTTVDENSGSQFICKAYYTDGTNAIVSPSWSENSSYTSINSAGYLSASAVPSNQSCIITASLGGKTDTYDVIISDLTGSTTTFSDTNIVLIHGVNSGSSTWNEMAPEISKFAYPSDNFNQFSSFYVEIAIEHSINDGAQCVDGYVTNEEVACKYLGGFIDGMEDQNASFRNAEEKEYLVSNTTFGLDKNNFTISNILWKLNIVNSKLAESNFASKQQEFSTYRVFAINFSNNKHLTFNAQGYELKSAIDDITKVTGISDFILIGHSMGGLAARAYIQNESTQNIKALITIDTPHLGGKKVLGFGAGSYDFFGNAGLNLGTNSYAIKKLNNKDNIESKYDNIMVYYLGYSDDLNDTGSESFYDSGDGVVEIWSQMGFDVPGELSPYKVIFSNEVGSSEKYKTSGVDLELLNEVIKVGPLTAVPLPPVSAHSAILKQKNVINYIVSLLPISKGETIGVKADLSFRLPNIMYCGINYWVDFNYFGQQNGIDCWSLFDLGVSNSTPVTISSLKDDNDLEFKSVLNTNAIIINSDLSFQIPSATYNKTQVWANFKYFGEKNGVLLWALGDSGTGTAPNPGIPVQPPSQTPANTKNNSLGMNFVYIAPGTFTMGSPTDEPGRDNDETQHQVTLTKGYYMQTTEVTQGQWEAVMGSNPSYFKSCGSDCPVEKVSWDDAQSFITQLNQLGEGTYMLPTEAQWEYAARAGSTTAFANGAITETGGGYDPNLDAMGWYTYNADSKTHPVAQKAPNAWGIYDMHGNVWDWCQDRYSSYTSGSVTDPAGPSSGWPIRLIRGGGWNSYAKDCRLAVRYNDPSEYSRDSVGFRLVMLSLGQP